MFRLGAHVSISGGVWKAVKRQKELGGNCGQIFVGSPRGWKVSSVDDDDADRFKERSESEDVKPWIIHGTYLINFATPKNDLAEKSMKTVQGELDAGSKLDIPYYVFHPGSHTGAGVEQGVQNVADRISQIDIPDNTKLLLENTSGKGTSLGKTFEQLNEMVERSDYGYDRVGICLDTCHLYSAGYDFTSRESINEMLEEIHSQVGIENIDYLHLNDSKHPFGSEKDEHEHVGEGEIGEKGFSLFINHPDLRDLPMALETPENSKGYAWNIKKVKELRD